MLSATPSGEIIFWDIEKYEIIKTIYLRSFVPEFKKYIISLKIDSNKIICSKIIRVLLYLKTNNF